MRVTLHGVRGSTPAPGPDFVRVGGHTSCVSVTLTGESSPSLVLDAGTGLVNLARVLGRSPLRGVIVLSHLHWDHVQGLPFFTAGDRADARVTLYLPAQDGARPDVPGSGASILRKAMSPPHFPIGPDGLAGMWRFEAADSGWLDAGSARVMLAEIPHKGGRTFGIRVEADGASFAYLPDHHAAADSEPGAKLARGVDVLFHDAQFAPDERAIASAYGHATVSDAVDLAERAGAGRLVLIHHAPSRTDTAVEQLAAATVATAALPVSLGREGDVVEL